MSWGEDLAAVLFVVLALAVIAVCIWLARRYGGARLVRGGKRRLGVVEATPIDGRRNLVLVRRDDVEHLLLLGPAHDLVIETRIVPPEPLIPSGG